MKLHHSPGHLFSEEPQLGSDAGTPTAKRETTSFDKSNPHGRHTVSWCGRDSSMSCSDADKPFWMRGDDFLFQLGDTTQTLTEKVTQKTRRRGSVTSGFSTTAPPLDLEGVMRLIQSDTQPHTEVTIDLEKELKKKRNRKDVDLDAISDEDERRTERRKAKNRRTAAMSRLRKKAKLENLERQIAQLQEENQKLKSLLSYAISQGMLTLCPKISELADYRGTESEPGCETKYCI